MGTTSPRQGLATSTWSLPLRLAVQEVSSHRMRSGISAFAVFLGVAAYLVMTSFSKGMEAQNSRMFLQMGGAEVVTVETMKAKDPSQEALFAKSPGLRLSELYVLQKRVPEIETVLPTIASDLRFRIGGRQVRGRAQAQGWDNFAVYNYVFDSVPGITRETWENGAAVALIGSRVAEDLRKATGKVIGQELSLESGGRVRVAGLLKTASKFDRRSMEIVVPLKWLLREQGSTNPVIPSSAVKIRSLEVLPEAVQAMKAELLVLHRGVPDVDVTTNEDTMKESQQTIRVMATVTGIISGIALISGGVGILNILFASLAARIRDLGVQKALGATPRLVFRQVFFESLLVSGTGGLLGCATGILPSLIAKNALPFQPVLSASDILTGLAMAFGVGIGAGLLPAMKAARLDPVEAMRA